MKLREQILGMSEVMGGRPLTDAGVAIMLAALAKYPDAAVRTALARVSRECRSLSLPEVLERLPGASPGSEEAWAICSGAYDEGATVVWTPAMASAFGEVRHMSDKVAARMAFREVYLRYRGTEDGPPSWAPSMGHDARRRLESLQAAEDRGWLPAGRAAELCKGAQPAEQAKALPASTAPAMAPRELASLSEEIMRKLKGTG